MCGRLGRWTHLVGFLPGSRNLAELKINLTKDQEKLLDDLAVKLGASGHTDVLSHALALTKLVVETTMDEKKDLTFQSSGQVKKSLK